MKKQLLSLALITQIVCAQDLQDTKKLEEAVSTLPQENFFIPTLDWIKSLNKDYQRDFYINQYLQSKITPKEAQEALALASDVNIEMFINFADKFNHDETKAVATCLKMGINELKISYADCIATGLTLKKASKLNSIELDLIKEKIKRNYPTLEKKLRVITAAIPFTKLVVLKGNELVDIYLNVDESFRSQYFNYKLPKRTIAKISQNKQNKIDFIEKTILSEDLKKVQNSLVKFDSKDLNFDTTFLLAINAIELGKKDLASKYLSLCLGKKDLQEKDLDKIHFWKYLLLKNKEELELLASSTNINIYSILAKELINRKIAYDIKKNDFITPYENLFKGLTSKEKSFYYSWIKTKSNFNEKQLTKDSKLGAFALDMNIIKEISKKLNSPFDISKQFFITDNFDYIKEYSKAFNKEDSTLVKLLKMDKVSSINFYKEDNLEKRLVLLEKELFKKDSYKEFVINYFFYHKLIKKKTEKNIKFSSIIFGKKGLSDQTPDEKVLN